MLRRSQAAQGAAMLSRARETRRQKSITSRPLKQAQFLNTSEQNQGIEVGKMFEPMHGYPARPEQIESVVELLNDRPTFLLAGTGFGKSRVPEMYYHAHESDSSPIVLCINPLDSLGDDQVSEKKLVELGAINLTGPNCTQEACNAILEGKHPFVYVSPEVALTSDIFDRMWQDPRFQARLILTVVDEAHMIYSWGLVASGQAKKLASHVRVQDVGAFRPSYGDLARRFLSTVKVPLLLMSATCTPQAIRAILANLKLDIDDVRFSRAELVRPEIRLLRRTFKRPLKASLRGLFAHHTLIPTTSIPPTLLYSGTQNATLEFLNLINISRGQPTETSNPFSHFARRYHASTGPEAKLDAVAAFIEAILSVLCCTLALGLGQNWHRVRRVVVVGRQDPCNLIQMTGRCGRDGRRGLGIMLVEHKRTNGKNTITDFVNPTIMSDDDRMDALAITPVCLRVALAVDLKYGYIPLFIDHHTVLEEAKRQKDAGMADCDCSTCQPESAEALWIAQPALTSDNFDSALAMSETELNTLRDSLPDPPPPPPTAPRDVALLCVEDDPILDSPQLQALVTLWEKAFIKLHTKTFPGASDLGPEDFFDRDLAWDLAKNVDLFHTPADLGIVLVSELIPGQFNSLFGAFLKWKDEYQTNQALSDAKEHRRTTIRPNGPLLPPQSVEGSLISKSRAEIEKQAVKEAREEAKLLAAEAKVAERAQRAHEKAIAADLAKLKAAEAKAAIRAQRARERLVAVEAAKKAAIEARAAKKKEKLDAKLLAKQLSLEAKANERAKRARDKCEGVGAKEPHKKRARALADITNVAHLESPHCSTSSLSPTVSVAEPAQTHTVSKKRDAVCSLQLEDSKRRAISPVRPLRLHNQAICTLYS